MGKKVNKRRKRKVEQALNSDSGKKKKAFKILDYAKLLH